MSALLTLFDGDTFSPRRLFLSSTIGAIYDYDSFAYLYQKSDGSTPVTALEQPVGLVVDQRYGGTRGDNKWNTAAASFTGESSQVSSGVYRLYSSAGAYSLVSSTYTVTAGRHYEVSFTVDSVAVAGAGIQFESVVATPTVASTVGTKRVIVLATSTAAIGLKRASTAMDVQISNISVRELPGLHAYQSTDAARPVLSARYNLLLATATLSTQSVTTLAASYTLTFTGAGTVTLSGTATGVKSAGSNVFTATAGTLTLTVSGDVTLADLRLTADANSRIPAYQRVTTNTDYDTQAGFKRFDLSDRTDDHFSVASGGGGTTGFLLCAAIQPTGAGTARTIFSDRGTNTGYKVEIDASNNLLFTAGNGAAFTTCTGPALTAGTPYVITCWHDGTNLNIRVNRGATTSQAFATATAGSTGFTIGKDNGAASGYYSGRRFALTYIKDWTVSLGALESLIVWTAAKGAISV